MKSKFKKLKNILISLRKIISTVKWFLINRYNLQSYTNINSQSIIYFDLKFNPFDRYLYLLGIFLEKENYLIVFKKRYSFIGSWSTSLLINNLKNVYFSNNIPDNTILKITDSNLLLFDKYISSNYFNVKSDSLYIPMPMVDTFYKLKKDEECIKLRNNFNRKIKIFFAGNIDKVSHNRIEIFKYFGINTRVEVVDWLRKNYMLVEPNNETQWNDVIKKSCDIVIGNRKIANIKAEFLPIILSNSVFFIALPGAVMPLCHNLIEAMACGCIPILNFNSHLHPKLEHGINCLLYENLNDLEKVINEALFLEKEVIEVMRNNVIAYYDDYLSVKSVVNNIIYGKEKNLLLNAEYNSLKFINNYHMM